MPSRRNLEYNKTPNNYEALGRMTDGQDCWDNRLELSDRNAVKKRETRKRVWPHE
jgi:hypothetical protein